MKSTIRFVHWLICARLRGHTSPQPGNPRKSQPGSQRPARLISPPPARTHGAPPRRAVGRRAPDEDPSGADGRIQKKYVPVVVCVGGGSGGRASSSCKHAATVLQHQQVQSAGIY